MAKKNNGNNRTIILFLTLSFVFIALNLFAGWDDYRAFIDQVFVQGGTFESDITFQGQILAKQGTAASPSYGFSSDPDTGIYNIAANQIDFVFGGVNRWQMMANEFKANYTNGAYLKCYGASLTTPFVAYSGDNDTGIGAISGELSLVVSGVQVAGAKDDGTVSGFVLKDTGTKPTCDSDHRGWLWIDEGGAGVKDSLEICAKDAGDAYAWRTIY